MLHYFASRIGPEEVVHVKPHPEAVLRSLAVFGVAAEEACFVGDTHFDVLAAHAACVQCLCVTTGYATRQQLEALDPEAVYDTLNEVARHVIEGLGIPMPSPIGKSDPSLHATPSAGTG